MECIDNFGDDSRYRSNGYSLYIKENLEKTETIIYMEDNGKVHSIGIISIIYTPTQRTVTVLFEFKNIDEGFDYKRMGVSKTIYNFIIKRYDPSDFDTAYTGDNLKVFNDSYELYEGDLRKSCNATPSGKVLKSLNYSADLELLNYSPPPPPFPNVRWKKNS